tara:strand:+ start:398 stop:517 length:120 start_codon:yes stop_codon:yes gene_type:complete
MSITLIATDLECIFKIIILSWLKKIGKTNSFGKKEDGTK